MQREMRPIFYKHPIFLRFSGARLGLNAVAARPRGMWEALKANPPFRPISKKNYVSKIDHCCFTHVVNGGCFTTGTARRGCTPAAPICIAKTPHSASATPGPGSNSVLGLSGTGGGRFPLAISPCATAAANPHMCVLDAGLCKCRQLVCVVCVVCVVCPLVAPGPSRSACALLCVR